MSDLYWLTDEQMERLRPFFPRATADQVSTIGGFSSTLSCQPQRVAMARCAQGLWPAKTLYNRWKRWGEADVFVWMMEGLAAAAADPRSVMIDATYLRAHRMASSLAVKKGGLDD